ncbi:MAG: metal ABC transporter substrate-binding protein [Polyangiales bacterium]
MFERAKKYPRRSALAAAAVIAASGAGLATYRMARRRHRPLRVVTTLFPIYDLVRRIAGSAVETRLAVDGSQARPKAWLPSERDLPKLKGVELGFSIGLGFDEWLIDALGRASQRSAVVVELGPKVDPLFVPEEGSEPEGEDEEGEEEGIERESSRYQGPRDPHVWLDPLRMSSAAALIASGLSQLDRSNATFFESQSRNVQASLQQLHVRTLARTRSWNHVAFASLDNSLTYYAARFDLSIPAVLEVVSGEPPTRRRKNEVLAVLKARPPAAVVWPKQLDGAPARELAQTLGVSAIEIDPIGGGAGVDTYEAIIDGITATLERFGA